MADGAEAADLAVLTHSWIFMKAWDLPTHQGWPPRTPRGPTDRWVL